MHLGPEKSENLSGATQHITGLTGSRSLDSSSATTLQPSQPSPPAHPAQPCSPRTREVPYFLWTSVSVMPCSVTLKWTTVGVGRTSLSKVAEMAFSTARAPLRVSTLTELRYRAWQPGRWVQILRWGPARIHWVSGGHPGPAVPLPRAGE